MAEIVRGRKMDFTIADVIEVYEGPVGVLWEMLMGKEIHVGGERETDVMAEKAGVSRNTSVLDVCCASGGPARHLAKKFGCRVTGLDATGKMVDEAVKTTEEEGIADLVNFKYGNALDMPFKAGTFDLVWGQDAWCYVTDKARLIGEACRVLKPGGGIAFTDWIQTGSMTDDEWEALNIFMVFPYMETQDGYDKLLKEVGFRIIEKEDLSEDFARYCHIYKHKLSNELKEMVIKNFGEDMFQAADDGLSKWAKAADEGKVGRGRWIGKKI